MMPLVLYASKRLMQVLFNALEISWVDDAAFAPRRSGSVSTPGLPSNYRPFGEVCNFVVVLPLRLITRSLPAYTDTQRLARLHGVAHAHRGMP